MARRQSTPKQQKTFAANAAFLVTAAILSAPVFAATTNSIPRSDISEATLEVSVNAFVAEVVGHDVPVVAAMAPTPGNVPVDDFESISSASLLAPRAEAAIRDAFRESDRSSKLQSSAVRDGSFGDSELTRPMAGAKSKSHTTVNSDAGTLPIRDMNTKLPGVSDAASSRYKKQMFRRDI